MRIVITGANRGMGLELARQYLARGDSVHAGVREPERAAELAALAESSGGRLRIHPCDVALDASVRAFASAVAEPVDLLINNAGIRNRVRADGIEELDLDDAARVFQVNALGALRVTGALLPLLRRGQGARVVSVSSGLSSIGDNTSGGAYGYRMSKAALNMAARSMAHDLKGDGIISVVLSPGWVRTDMGGASAPTPVAESVAGLIGIIDRLAPGDSGSFMDFRGERIGW
ncbi:MULTISPECIES: SDR family oxidoreductase [Corallococcus]|uniref:SDR family oxidoreductase n=1 Tax=Corallococcus TaxID=83461 RepID=UPI001180D155|nr:MULTISPECIES: SDR family oxidoreductase [Corallococcus]NBD08427.1 SDR family NAD(P)-dependent oxidoreductase [Corallococcus silvisoli]TSC34372.1 SDR family oxidoreductase [Corallococcus sp. Z5C101001]